MRKMMAMGLVVLSVLLVASVAFAERTTIPGGPGVLSTARYTFKN